MTEQEAKDIIILNSPFVGSKELQEAVNIAIQALEKQIPKKPIHKKIVYGKHKWKWNDRGEIDEFAWEYDYHYGVVCEVCDRTECVMCNVNYDELEDCEVEKYFCPTCNEDVGYVNSHCKKCDQKLDRSEEEEDV